jgi:hypothetical protein
MTRRSLFLLISILCAEPCFCWGFFAHRQINYLAVFLLPPEMIGFYKKNQQFLADHAVDPDKRRYAIAEEASRHFIDLDRYGRYPFDSLPRQWDEAVKRYSQDSLLRHGIVPWWIQIMLSRLTKAFREKDAARILKLSADMGHYISDAHVPLHASSNHNGQHTGQHGIHGFWESRIPESFAAASFDFLIGKAVYIDKPLIYTWDRVLESAASSDTVLRVEKRLSEVFPSDMRYAFEDRNGLIVRQYSSHYTREYHLILNGMVERRMRQSIFSVSSFWYTAWVNAGQPDLRQFGTVAFDSADRTEWDSLNRHWRAAKIIGRACE